MSYKDNLKYDVLVAYDGKRFTGKTIASFENYGLATSFIKQMSVTSTPFNAVRDNELVLDMRYDGGLYCLLSQPGVSLPDTAGHECIKKSDIVEKAIMAGQFDYALPQDWLNDVVKVLAEDDYDDRNSIYSTVVFGTVWYYPKVKVFGRVMGRPSVITSEAERALLAYIELSERGKK